MQHGLSNCLPLGGVLAVSIQNQLCVHQLLAWIVDSRS